MCSPEETFYELTCHVLTLGETNHSANQSDNKVLLDQNYIYTETFITWYQRDTSALWELQIIIIL